MWMGLCWLPSGEEELPTPTSWALSDTTTKWTPSLLSMLTKVCLRVSAGASLFSIFADGLGRMSGCLESLTGEVAMGLGGGGLIWLVVGRSGH